MSQRATSFIRYFFPNLRRFAGVAIALLSVSAATSFAQKSPAEVEALMDKCFDRKVAEERQRGGSVLGTMIPALLGECKTEIDAANSKGAEPALANSAATASSAPAPANATPTEKSKLPPCRGTNVKAWNMCVGTETDSDGRKYVGEFADGEPSGLGTLYHPDGITITGRWKSGQVDQMISCVGLPMCSQN